MLSMVKVDSTSVQILYFIIIAYVKMNNCKQHSKKILKEIQQLT